MSKKAKTLDALKRAEDAGFRVMVDTFAWHQRRDIRPPTSDAASCDLVVAARTLAEIVEKRPASPPDGVVYERSNDELTAALGKAVAYIERAMRGENDAQPAEDVDQRDKQKPADGGADAAAGDRGGRKKA